MHFATSLHGGEQALARLMRDFMRCIFRHKENTSAYAHALIHLPKHHAGGSLM